MKKLEKYGVQPLDNEEYYTINGGDQAEGSYSFGYKIGVYIKGLFKTKIWIGWG